jgi:hypothetical protein
LIIAALDAQGAAVSGDPIGQAAQAGALPRRCAAHPVVRDADDQPPVLTAGLESDPRGVDVLDRVRHALGGDEIGGGLDAAIEPLVGSRDEHRHRCAGGQFAQRRGQPGVELGRRKTARQLAELVDGDGNLCDGAVERVSHVLGRGRGQLVLCVAQGETDRDEPLLGTVVKVAFDAAALRVCRADDAGPGRLDLRELSAELHTQARNLDREAAALDDLAKQGGMLLAAWIVEHHCERLSVAFDRNRLPASELRDGGTPHVDVQLALGQVEQQVEQGVARPVRRAPHTAGGHRRAGARIDPATDGVSGLVSKRLLQYRDAFEQGE